MIAIFALSVLFQSAVCLGDEHPLDFARRLLAEGLYDAAGKELETFLRENPQSPHAQEARFLAGTSHHLLGDCEKAISHLSRYLDKPEDNLRAGEASYRLGECLLITGDFEQSIEAFERVRRDFPESEFAGVAVVGAAEAYSKAGNLEAALGYFDAAISQFPESEFAPRARFGRGLARASFNRFESALEDLTRFRQHYKEDPLRPYALLTAARIYLMDLGEATRARELFELLRTDYHSPELEAQAALGISRALFMEGKYAEAQDELTSVLANYEDANTQDEARWILASVYLESGSIAKSAETDSLALVANTVYADQTVIRLAQSLLELGRYDKAIASLQDFEPQDPALGVLADQIAAECYYESGKFVDAVSKLEEVFESDAAGIQRIEAGYMIAEIYASDLGQPLLANYWYDKIIRTFGRSAGAQSLFRQASLLEDAGEYRDALSNYQRILDQYPRSPLVDESSSRISLIRRFWLVNTDSAIQNLVSVIHGESAQDPRLSLALVYEKDLKNFERALAYLNAYLSDCEGCPEELLKKASLLLLFAERLKAEMRTLEASEMESRAMATLSQVAELDPSSEWAANARSQMIRLRSTRESAQARESIDAWEDFLDTYDDSSFRDVALFHLADLLLRDGYTEENGRRAEALLIELVEYHPASQFADNARVMLGDICLLRELPAEALSHFQRALFDYPNSELAADAVYGIGISGRAIGDREGALGAFGRAISDYRYDEDVTEKAWMELAGMLIELRRFGEAHDSLRVFFDLYPQSSMLGEAGLLAVRTYHGLGKPAEALISLEQVIASADESLTSRALDLVRVVSVSSGYLHDGIRLGRKVLEQDSTNVKALSLVSELMIQSGQPGEVIELLGGLENAEELHTDVKIQMARAALRANKDKAAANIIRSLEKSLPDDDPGAAILKLEQAELWLSRGDYSDAESAFGKIVSESAGTDWEDDALFGVARCRLMESKYADARKTLQDIISRFPSTPLLAAVYLKLGSAYYFEQMFAEARDAYNQSARTATTPNIAADAYFNLALACERLSDWQCSYDAALKVLETSAVIDLRASAIFKAGYALQELGQYSQAIEYYRQALSGASRELSAEIRYWMGECYGAMGEYHLAVSEFLKVAYLYSDEGMWGVTAELRAADVYETTGELAEARKIYNRVLEKFGKDSIWGKSAAEKLAAMSGEPQR
jgi:tetratricopeptide (TPR) repeat protein